MSFFLLKKAHIYLFSLEVSISLRIAWEVRRVVLALDGDKGGRDAMERLAEEFRHARAGLTVSLCPPPLDGWGKDWSERYRKGGQGASGRSSTI